MQGYSDYKQVRPNAVDPFCAVTVPKKEICTPAMTKIFRSHPEYFVHGNSRYSGDTYNPHNMDPIPDDLFSRPGTPKPYVEATEEEKVRRSGIVPGHASNPMAFGDPEDDPYVMSPEEEMEHNGIKRNLQENLDSAPERHFNIPNTEDLRHSAFNTGAAPPKGPDGEKDPLPWVTGRKFTYDHSNGHITDLCFILDLSRNFLDVILPLLVQGRYKIDYENLKKKLENDRQTKYAHPTLRMTVDCLSFIAVCYIKKMGHNTFFDIGSKYHKVHFMAQELQMTFVACRADIACYDAEYLRTHDHTKYDTVESLITDPVTSCS